MNAVSRSLSFRRPSGFTETFTEPMLARASLKSTKKARLSHSKDFTFHWCWKVSVCCIRKERKPEAYFWTSLYSPSLIMYISKMRNCSGRTWKGVSLEILYSASLRSETLWELLPQHARTERSSKKWFFISNDSIRHPNLPQSSRIFCAVPSLVLIYIFAHYWRIHDTQKKKRKKKKNPVLLLLLFHVFIQVKLARIMTRIIHILTHEMFKTEFWATTLKDFI